MVFLMWENIMEVEDVKSYQTIRQFEIDGGMLSYHADMILRLIL